MLVPVAFIFGWGGHTAGVVWGTAAVVVVVVVVDPAAKLIVRLWSVWDGAGGIEGFKDVDEDCCCCVLVANEDDGVFDNIFGGGGSCDDACSVADLDVSIHWPVFSSNLS